MTEQQTIAISNPCELPEQCANQRYRKLYKLPSVWVSTLLTVNVGEE